MRHASPLPCGSVVHDCYDLASTAGEQFRAQSKPFPSGEEGLIIYLGGPARSHTYIILLNRPEALRE